MTGRFLKACLNGPREPSEHPALPVTPAAIAADAAAAVAAGADALHIHPKDPAGHDTLEPDVVAAVLEAVRAAVPGVPVGLTTAAPAAPEPAERIELVRGWTVRPDFASVNWHEPGSPELAETLLGIAKGPVELVSVGGAKDEDVDVSHRTLARVPLVPSGPRAVDVGGGDPRDRA